MILLPFVAIVAVCYWGFRPFEHAEEFAGKIAIDRGTHTIRVVGETGNLQIVIGSAGKLEFLGRALSVVASEGHLADLKSAPVTLVRDTENEQPGVMVVRVSALPDGFRRIVSQGQPPGSAEDRRPGVFRQVDVEIRVPVELQLELTAEEVNLRVDTRQALTSVDVEKGNVLIMHTSEALRVRNGGGPTIIQEHRGALDAEVGGELRVTLSELSAPTRLLSKTGKISLYLPAHSSFKIDATSSAIVRNAFGLRGQKTGPSEFQLLGAVGGGKHSVIIKALAGPVTLALPEK